MGKQKCNLKWCKEMLINCKVSRLEQTVNLMLPWKNPSTSEWHNDGAMKTDAFSQKKNTILILPVLYE